ncbi:hypothetical protein JM83_1096 [Gillisia sp. Hel_I_86]|nr:hypothetical protein JM83_1096 [Gillisia sp. Hel_I_86]
MPGKTEKKILLKLEVNLGPTQENRVSSSEILKEFFYIDSGFRSKTFSRYNFYMKNYELTVFELQLS